MAIQQIFTGEVNEFVKRYRGTDAPPVDLALRARFNPALDKAWFGSVVQIINHITLLSIILTGAALIREREHGTIEHLLVMPVTPAQIMLSKVWSMALVVLIALPVPQPHGARRPGRSRRGFHCAVLRRRGAQSVRHHVDGHLHRHPGAQHAAVRHVDDAHHHAAADASGGTTPRESMPEIVQNIMLIAPTTHFVELSQAILYRGAGLRRYGSPSWRWP